MTKLDTRGFYPKVKGKQRKMAELLVNPDCDLTITQMCKQIGVSRQTFYNWQNDSDFNGYVSWLIDQYTDSELARAWKALIKRVDSGNIEAIKLYFELKGKYKQQIDINGGVVFMDGEAEILD